MGLTAARRRQRNALAKKAELEKSNAQNSTENVPPKPDQADLQPEAPPAETEPKPQEPSEESEGPQADSSPAQEVVEPEQAKLMSDVEKKAAAKAAKKAAAKAAKEKGE